MVDLPTELLELLRSEWTETTQGQHPSLPSSLPFADAGPTFVSPPALAPLACSPRARLHALLTQPASATSSIHFASLLQLSHDRLSSFAYASVPTPARRLYTEIGFLWSLNDCLTPEGRTASDWEESVGRLDRVLIVSGAPERAELVHILIRFIQETYLPLPPLPPTPSASSSPPMSKRPRLLSPSNDLSTLAPNVIPRLDQPPSLGKYRSHLLSQPFILPLYLARTHWPAVVDPKHKWSSGEYLLRVGGRGRLVPVEVDVKGSLGGYADDGWGQTLISWETFLRRSGFLPPLSRVDQDAKEGNDGEDDRPLYLAQHDLFAQFPKLAADILTPDYVFSSPPPTPTYQPPTTESGVVINVWAGKGGRGSPAHTDPFYNCFAQVVGRKRVLLVPPHHKEAMYPFSSAGPDENADEEGKSPTQSLMGNTSRLPLLIPDLPPDRQRFPAFYDKALPDALEGVLEEGDLLVFPPGWWHALRMEGGAGWGVSFWY